MGAPWGSLGYRCSVVFEGNDCRGSASLCLSPFVPQVDHACNGEQSRDAAKRVHQEPAGGRKASACRLASTELLRSRSCPAANDSRTQDPHGFLQC